MNPFGKAEHRASIIRTKNFLEEFSFLQLKGALGINLMKKRLGAIFFKLKAACDAHFAKLQLLEKKMYVALVCIKRIISFSRGTLRRRYYIGHGSKRHILLSILGAQGRPPGRPSLVIGLCLCCTPSDPQDWEHACHSPHSPRTQSSSQTGSLPIKTRD